MSSYNWAYEHKEFNAVLGELQQLRLLPSASKEASTPKHFSRASWIATLLANSPSHVHRRKALLFAALAKQVLQQHALVETLCYAIFARTGALPAAMHLSKVVDDTQQYSGPRLGPLSDEFAAAYKSAYSKDSKMLLTDFQKRTTKGLIELDAGIISAPTSAGKSFIVHQYVKSQISSGPFVALFIVPTKALIAQTCAVYRRFSKKRRLNLAVLSSVPEHEIQSTDKIVLALTQERCVRLLSSQLSKQLSFIFADEIQSLEDGDRGALLEYVLHKLRELAPSAKMFAAGPFIEASNSLGKALFEKECVPLETEDSPVSQMIVEVTPTRNSKTLQLKVINASAAHDASFVLETTHSLFSRWRNSQTDAISDTIKFFKGKTPSIVYARGPGTAQNWANGYAQTIEPAGSLSTEANELIEFIKDSIHPKCSLVNCLQRNTAYHHGALPDFVREEVESLYLDGKIDVLFCTSTLLEGVNLPAEKIILISAKKAQDQLTRFEFRNLIGRAGRLDQHLCGLIYCIQIPDEKPSWIEEFRDETRKAVKPTVDEKLTSDFDSIKSILEAGSPVTDASLKNELRSTAVILRSRYLNGSESVSSYLKSKGLTADQEQSLVEALRKNSAEWTVPSEVLLKNPYVDPVLQNQLFQKISDDPSQWIVRRERGFSVDFERVFKMLDDIFKIVDEIDPIGNPTYYRSDLLKYAKLWIFGKPFREIVVRALPSSIRNDPNLTTEAVDGAIKKAMRVITHDVAFVTAKYFSVLSELLRLLVNENESNEYSTTLALPAMLEFGCSDPKALALIRACVPRAAALRIVKTIPVDVEDPVVWLMLNQKHPELTILPTIYKKILRRIGIWS